MFCKNCGSQINDYATVCPRCGIPTNQAGPSPYQQGRVFCRNCGNQINPGAPVCVHCGLPTGNPTPNQPGFQEPVNAGFVVLSVLVPLFGIIYGAVKMNSGQKKAGQVYLWVGLGIMIFNVLIGIISGVVAAASVPTIIYR